MKVELSKDGLGIVITGNFDKTGVPTKAAEADSSNDGLNHGSTGFPVATGCRFKDAEGQERELYVGVNVTSHLVKGSKAKPKL
jgi:hypothetical protein